MSDDSQTICPECQTRQTAGAPFCENCGYRIRPRNTVKEGHQALTAEVMRRARVGQADDGPAPGSSLGDADTELETSGAYRPDQHKRGGLGRDGPIGAAKTNVENLSAIDDKNRASQPKPTAATREPGRAASRSAVIDRPDQGGSDNGKMAIYITIWASVTAVAVLATYFLTKQVVTPDASTGTAVEVADTVSVARGSFVRGLDGEVRSFILKMCHKLEDDPAEACRQEMLLDGEYPEQTIDLAAYDIDATETTVGEYRDCVSADGCSPVDYDACEVWTHQGLQVSLRVPKALRRDPKPVVCVTPVQARAYCQWNDGRLPSGDQWEKAARGTDGRLFPWGASWSSDVANWAEMDIARNPIVGELDGYEWTAPVGQFPDGKSPFGAYDMAGNVAEWVATDQKSQTRVARGGSWTSHPFDLRATGRQKLEDRTRRTDVGFRCVYQ